jgi:hypothetical protein
MYLLELLKQIPDTRKDKGKMYPLAEILFIFILASSCGYTSYRKVAEFVNDNWATLCKYLKLRKEFMPKYNTLREILLSVDSRDLEKIFRQHAFKLNSKPGAQIAVDGKSIKGSADFQTNERCLHFVNFFDVNRKIILAHEPVDKKTNEIPVFQNMLVELGIADKLFTADAMHCQKKQ